jgi:carboxypeptidase C (cathepsin A)
MALMAASLLILLPLPVQPQDSAAAAARPAAPAVAPERERLSVTSHAVRIGGQDVRYTATAGTLLLEDEAGAPKAQAFFVAYTREGTSDIARRPITFAYNGGPGSASIWLHMGALGPRRVQMAEDGFQPGPPYRLVDNEQSIIDVTDLVMIDPVMTGYSRPVPGEDKKQFHGVNEDLKWVGEFIRRYLSRFNRWRSPKFLLGESYGTFRSAGLAPVLQRRGIELNGIVLVSSVLDFATLRSNEGNDLPFITFLPTYTATAWYHNRLAPELQADFGAALDQSRAFAIGEFASALVKGNMLSLAERRSVAESVAQLTGVSAEFVERANLRVDPARFRKELLRDQRLVTGRLDSRYTAMDADAAGERQEFDPSNHALGGAYTAMFVDYVSRELGYQSDLVYYTSGQVRPWNYGDYTNRYATQVDALRGAMARNPYLKILVTNGYYDMATPFFGTEYTFAHLAWEPSYTDRVTMTYYEGGHMMYIIERELAAFKQDIARFIDSALPPRAVTTRD